MLEGERWDHSSIAIDRTVYVYGGRNRCGDLKTIEFLSFDHQGYPILARYKGLWNFFESPLEKETRFNPIFAKTENDQLLFLGGYKAVF